MSSPPPPPDRPYQEPPPLPPPKWRPGEAEDGSKGTAIALAVVAVLALLGFGAYYAYEVLAKAPEPEVAEAEAAPVVNPLSEQLAAVAGRNERYLLNEAYVKRVFVQNARIIRYQLIYADLVDDGRPVFAEYTKRRRPTLEVLRADTLVAPVLQQAESIYVDVYNQDDDYAFSYDLVPGDVWE